jgi:hypothetical protein
MLEEVRLDGRGGGEVWLNWVGDLGRRLQTGDWIDCQWRLGWPSRESRLDWRLSWTGDC